ncbi:fasciclin domain-containing protein [Pedobacter sp. HMF7647]|uniref:Fasciclin domain-containing protein n=1 Tax=Hufsiella arboris TaxID=2695275 RepID=A0A7K1Y986_9SPHI|nr:fasciclin domain-containing protein [Hufsiella arboris]MXV50649.1 fasciclin domain-containing protein [Hufsiella arboris]
MKKIFLSLLVSGLFLSVNSLKAQTDSTGTKQSTGTSSTSSSSGATTTTAQTEMAPNKTIIENVSQSPDYSTLVSDLKSTGLDQTLTGSGPYTIFAPTNDAFTKLSATASTKDKLAEILKYHVVPGKYTSQDIAKAIVKGNGSTTLTTLNGDKLIFKINANKNLELSDSKGNTALVTAFDKQQSNGVVHAINNVLLPKNSI